jgi:putative Mn2+ efflux pump MntP
VLPLLLLAVALGLDNLAAAVGIGVGSPGGVSGGTRVRIAVLFGLFEAGMPVLGLLLGHGLADAAGLTARWLGGAVLIAFGVVQARGLIRARRAGKSCGPGGPTQVGRTRPPRTERQWAGRRGVGQMLLGGLVLSGDNLAAGFALGAYHASLAVAATVFGVVSVAMALLGLELGARIGTVAGERGELVACALLIVVGGVIAAGAL